MRRVLLLAAITATFLIGQGWLSIAAFAMGGLVRFILPMLTTEPPVARMSAP